MTGNDQTNGPQEGDMTPPPAPPPVVPAPPRVTLHTRIRDDINTALESYRSETASSKQLIVEQALTEYLTRRNRWPGETQQA